MFQFQREPDVESEAANEETRNSKEIPQKSLWIQQRLAKLFRRNKRNREDWWGWNGPEGARHSDPFVHYWLERLATEHHGKVVVHQGGQQLVITGNGSRSNSVLLSSPAPRDCVARYEASIPMGPLDREMMFPFDRDGAVKREALLTRRKLLWVATLLVLGEPGRAQREDLDVEATYGSGEHMEAWIQSLQPRMADLATIPAAIALQSPQISLLTNVACQSTTLRTEEKQTKSLPWTLIGVPAKLKKEDGIRITRELQNTDLLCTSSEDDLFNRIGAHMLQRGRDVHYVDGRRELASKYNYAFNFLAMRMGLKQCTQHRKLLDSSHRSDYVKNQIGASLLACLSGVGPPFRTLECSYFADAASIDMLRKVENTVLAHPNRKVGLLVDEMHANQIAHYIRHPGVRRAKQALYDATYNDVLGFHHVKPKTLLHDPKSMHA